MTPGDLSAFLTAACGGPAEVWERQVSVAYALGLMREVIRHNSADGKPVAGDRRIEAVRALGWACEKARRRAAGVDVAGR
jgi:hypothetical protein